MWLGLQRLHILSSTAVHPEVWQQAQSCALAAETLAAQPLSSFSLLSCSANKLLGWTPQMYLAACPGCWLSKSAWSVQAGFCWISVLKDFFFFNFCLCGLIFCYVVIGINLMSPSLITNYDKDVRMYLFKGGNMRQLAGWDKCLKHKISTHGRTGGNHIVCFICCIYQLRCRSLKVKKSLRMISA